MNDKTQNKPFLVMNENEDRIDIHPEFSIVFNFLIQIESEIKIITEYGARLKKIHKQCREWLDLMIKMRPSDDFKFTLSEHPETMANKLHFVRPIRSEFIIQFAHLETLRCLYTAYKDKTSDRNKLRDASDKAIDNFINEFCLCKENQWIQKNSKRSGKIGAKNLRDLRNSLTHFFSVNKIGLVPLYDKESEKIENKINNKVQLLSPEDFENILHHAARLMLKKWSNDCKESMQNGNDNFIERMRCVKEVVEKNGARFIFENNVSKNQ